MLAGSLRVSTPFLFVSLGECLTEKSGRINLGNEGVLVLGAMVAYATSYETGSPWAGVARRGLSPACCWAACTARSARWRGSTTWRWASPSCWPAPASRSFSASRMCSPVRTCCRGFRWASGRTMRRCATRCSVCPLFLLGIVAAIAMRLVLPRHPHRSAHPYRRRQPGRGAGARAADRPHPLPRHRLRQRAGRHRRRVPVAVLPGKLERRPVVRPGTDGGRAGGVLALEPDQLHLCLAAVRRGRRARPVAANRRHHLGLLSVLRRALRRDAGRADHHRPRRPIACAACRGNFRSDGEHGNASLPIRIPGHSTAHCRRRTPR